MKYIFECSNELELQQLRDKLVKLFPLTNLTPKVDIDSDIDCRNFSARTANVLLAENIKTYRQLTQCTVEKLLSFNNMGAHSVAQIITELNTLGLELK